MQFRTILCETHGNGGEEVPLNGNNDEIKGLQLFNQIRTSKLLRILINVIFANNFKIYSIIILDMQTLTYECSVI
jgi:hypothetical protein